ITATIKRVAYVLIPLSLLFCKYYENLGRAFDLWGKSFYTGVTTDKNMFGYLLFVFGLFFAAAFMSKLTPNRGERGRFGIEQMINILLLGMIVWLIPIANSKTSMLSLIAGTAIIVALRLAPVRRHFWSFALVAILFVTAADEVLSVRSSVLEASG